MKSKDPEFRIPVSEGSFRCFKCDGVYLHETGSFNETEPGLEVKVCNDCSRPKKKAKADLAADTATPATPSPVGSCFSETKTVCNLM